MITMALTNPPGLAPAPPQGESSEDGSHPTADRNYHIGLHQSRGEEPGNDSHPEPGEDPDSDVMNPPPHRHRGGGDERGRLFCRHKRAES